MFATLLLIYLIGTAGMSASPGLVIAALIADAIAWAAIQNSFEAWFTGTTSDQEFWKEDNE